jgi:hypothetical protein
MSPRGLYTLYDWIVWEYKKQYIIQNFKFKDFQLFVNADAL